VEEKKLLRKQIQKSRDDIPDKKRLDYSKEIAQKFLSSGDYRKAENILIFFPFRSEVDTLPIIKKALSDNKKIILPRVNGSELELYFVNDPSAQLESGAYGIMEPCESCVAAETKQIDLAVIPGVCFDENFNRMGYGGGFYDKILAGLPENVKKIALCFQVQLIKSVPTEKHDIRVDKIITETKVYIKK
jgi:5-formyltetrahydrofolate cyclo-ligase